MNLEYSPTYSILKGCSENLVSELSYLLEHYIEEEQLQPFIKVLGQEFPFTKSYTFKAELNNNNTYNIKFYSGFINSILSFLNKKNIELKISSSVVKYSCKDISISDILYEHQKQIVSYCLKNKRGIIKSPTGSGKSYSIAEVVQKCYKDNLKILITVPTISLLSQLSKDINDFRKLAGYEKIELGQVGNGKYNFKDITIGIPNSLCKLNKTKEYLESVDVLIADEVHTCGNATYSLMISALNKRVVSLGLSATPGDNILLEAFFGPKILEIKEKDMIKKGIIMNPLFEYYISPNAFIPNTLRNHAANIQNLTNAHRYKTLANVYKYVISNNKGRNNLIAKLGSNRIDLNIGPILIIVNKVKGEDSHAETLVKLFKNKGYDLPIISGYISKKKKEGLIQDLKESNIVGAVAGPKILSAGIDIPSLSTIIFAGAGKSNSEYIQRVGRILRKKEGKGTPVVIDFKDSQYWFASQSKSRMKIAEEIYGSKNIILK